jgi:DNA-binding MarR family transcriptional regulator
MAKKSQGKGGGKKGKAGRKAAAGALPDGSGAEAAPSSLVRIAGPEDGDPPAVAVAPLRRPRPAPRPPDRPLGLAPAGPAPGPAPASAPGLPAATGPAFPAAAATVAPAQTVPPGLDLGLDVVAQGHRLAGALDAALRALRLTTVDLAVLRALLDTALPSTAVAAGDASSPRSPDEPRPLVVTATDLARLTGLAPTTVSSALRRAMERDDVVKDRHPRDGRAADLRLTDSGRRRWADACVHLEPLLQRFNARGTQSTDRVHAAADVVGSWVDGVTAERRG